MATTNSGLTYRVINTLERATSADANEFQLFGSKSIMDLFRRLFLVEAVPDANGFIVESQTATLTTPLSAFVAGGLLVNPQGGNMFVDPGSLLAIAPDPVPDSRDSVCVVANSDGVTVAGQLPFTAPTPAGGPRWDLVECRPQLSVTTATRDVFDPVTKQFSGQSLDKLAVTDLEFRIRTGAQASPTAAPSLAGGWLPIAAVWVPDTAASFDDCEIFDVRPMPKDLDIVRPSAGTGWEGSIQRNGAQSEFFGSIQRGGVGPDAKWRLNIPSINNCSPGLNAADPLTIPEVPAGGDFRYVGLGEGTSTTGWRTLVLQFPFGLSNWRRFGLLAEAVSGRRWPGDMQGLPVLTVSACDAFLDISPAMAKEWNTAGTQPGVAVSFVKHGTFAPDPEAAIYPQWFSRDGWWSVRAQTETILDFPTGVNLRASILPFAAPIARVKMDSSPSISNDPDGTVGWASFGITGWSSPSARRPCVVDNLAGVFSSEAEIFYEGALDYVTGALVASVALSVITPVSESGLVTAFQIVPGEKA